jgi:tetratricopeptide (TPR) repeat protein
MQARAAAAAAAAPAMPQAPEFSIEADVPAHETEDLSAEWDQSLTVDSSSEEAEVAEAPAKSHVPAVEAGAESPEIAEIVEETRFYLEHYMPDQARSAFARLESLTSDPNVLDALRAAIEGGSAKKPPQAEPVVEQAGAEEPQEFQIDVEMPAEETSHAAEEVQAHAEPAAQPAHAAEASDDLASIVADLEASLGDSFPKADAPEPLPAWPQTAPAHEPAASKPARPQPIPAPTPAIQEPAIAASAPASPSAAAPALSYSPTPVRPLGAGAEAIMPSAGVDLSEMFGELKHELEEENIPGKDDDPETHYNLGVAFREMGLLDEAIAELQKVCSSVERGHPFSQLVQTYTWLAQCFLDKNVPEAAVRWYEKALTVPGLNPESRVAIHYELGSACETAQDKKAALKHFTEVYGANIDYRDVAERIQALKS